jgi:hypothetical protein
VGGCGNPYPGLTAYTGALNEPNLLIYLSASYQGTFEGAEHYLRLDSATQNYTCRIVDTDRLGCFGPHAGTTSVTVIYTLFTVSDDCEVASGSLYLDYASVFAGQEVGGSSSGEEEGPELDQNGCYVGDEYSKSENLCCAPEDYYPEWDSCDPPTYEPLD